MNNFDNLFKGVMKAGEKIGENIGKSEMKCPRCKNAMGLFKKYPSLSTYFWTCDCGINFPKLEA